MEEKIKKYKTAGLIILGLGIICLITSLVLSFTLGTVAVPIFFCTSLILNTVAVRLIRYKG